MAVAVNIMHGRGQDNEIHPHAVKATVLAVNIVSESIICVVHS